MRVHMCALWRTSMLQKAVMIIELKISNYHAKFPLLLAIITISNCRQTFAVAAWMNHD